MQYHHKPFIYPGTVYLTVTNLSVSEKFYTEIIGLQVLNKSKNRVNFTTDGEHTLLTIEEPEYVQSKEKRTSGLYHFALLLPSRKDLGKVILHLAQNQIPIGAADHLVSEAIYLSDPDGNGIEIYIDRESDVWEWQNGEVKMATDPLNGEGIIAEVTDKTWEGLPAETVMGHVHLHVSNLHETELFYQKLGFEVVSHYPQALFMSNGKYHHHLGLNTWNGEGAPSPSENSAGLKAYTLIYPDKQALGQALERIDVAAGPNKTQTITDPSGIQIILTIE